MVGSKDSIDKPQYEYIYMCMYMYTGTKKTG